jgi:hypothetical protein
MSRRVDNWQIILASELAKPRMFSWGSNDCCTFACDIIEALTGIDPAKTFRGKYDSAIGCFKEIKRQGYAGVDDAATTLFESYGFKTIPVLMAQRGDVVLANIDNNETLGVVSDAGAMFISYGGYVLVNPSEMQKAWRIN